jgi:hypothetical protein
MKKILVSILGIMMIMFVFSTIKVYAETGDEILNSKTAGELIEIKEKAAKELQEFKDEYGNDTYGFTAFMLDKIRLYSIPLCFLGIAISAIYQYIIGIRKLDTRYTGFFSLIAFITILVICQVLPFVFIIVVKFGRG